jgi:putative SOS response-associated peptidase YedK
MLVLLQAEDFDAWLNGSLSADALRPAAESAVREWPVSRRVNRTGVARRRRTFSPATRSTCAPLLIGPRFADLT